MSEEVTFRDWLERQEILFFGLLLIGAVGSHLTVEFIFGGFAEGWSSGAARGLGIAVLVALGAAIFLRRKKTGWAWAGLGGLAAFQLLCLLLYQVLLKPAESGVLQAALMIGCVTAVYRAYRFVDDRGEGKIRVIGESDFRKTDSLVLFLSPPRGVPEGEQALPSDASILNLESFIALQKSSWYMPLVAIHKHAGMFPYVPLRIIVIPSADIARSAGTDPGTWRHWESFRGLVLRLAAPARLSISVDVLEAHRQGVDYENMRALSEALHAAQTHLKPTARYHVVLDITSGQASCSGVAAALTIHSREYFQYVSTVDYQVRQYDLKVEAPQLPIPD